MQNQIVYKIYCEITQEYGNAIFYRKTDAHDALVRSLESLQIMKEPQKIGLNIRKTDFFIREFKLDRVESSKQS